MRRCGSPWRHSPPRPAATAGAMADASAPRVTYFERDFDFDEHAAEVEATWDPAVGGGPAPAPTTTRPSGTRRRPRARRRASAVVGGDPSPSSDELTTARQSARWDEFHQHHDAGDFFKERRYLLAEFPALAVDAPTTILEIGCGSGSSCVPILRANPRARVLACDFSPAAVRCTARAAARGTSPTDSPRSRATVRGRPRREHRARRRVRGVVAVLLRADAPIRAACLVFVLSAVPPDALPAFLDSVRRAVSPGGVVFFRDYGVYDLPMLRFAPSARRESRVYARGDGTLARFFLVEGGGGRAVRLRWVRDDRSERRGTGAVLLRAQRKQEEGDQDATRVRARRLQKIARRTIFLHCFSTKRVCRVVMKTCKLEARRGEVRRADSC